ncbi:hypothetical protein BP6252_02663 [Coleophoma cylindrospora]|uniref:DUF2406 domain-containing protein n=1 Tax=Coleophoma cylindrospora TaxID=1849047 RepID=A0A3D8SFL0_9HELO|nr:hypothetical protein BP6252_02663 [Coleophoma cylindrospora]
MSAHPLPPAPSGQSAQHHYPQSSRPRAKSSFSFRSNHSHKSSQGSGHKIDLSESHDEKESRRLQTKADPTMAMSELEPSAVASHQKSSLASIRDIQHKDALGNLIADPDRSNPTRSRWERPLDTIRGFEAAIDGNYSRKSYARPESVSDASTWNRRSSYFGGTQVTMDDRPRLAQSGYYGGGASQRASSYRTESQYYVDGGRNGNGYYGNNGDGSPGPSNAYHPNRARYPRTASEPQFNASGVYPPNGNQHSYETVTTASGSGSNGEPAGYTTDPSSEGSINGLPGRDPAETYGMNFGGSPQYAPPGHGMMNYQHSSNGQGNGYMAQGPPPLQKSAVPRAAPIKLGSGDIGGPTVYEAPRPEPEKRKSWFGRRLSKNK